MEGLALKLALEGTALGHVPAVEHDGADVGLIEQIGGDDVSGQPLPLGGADPAFETDGGAETSPEHPGELRLDRQPVIRVHEIAQRSPFDRGGGATQHAGDGRALVQDAPVGVHKSDEVGGMLHHGLEPAFDP